MADEVTKPRPLGEEEVQDIQITLKSDANPMSVRDLRVCFNLDSYKRVTETLILLLVLPWVILSTILVLANQNIYLSHHLVVNRVAINYL